ncbi:MAG TPA: hypothetical protein VGC97_08730 [Pyrinomonadaceae bacterium]|jgi:hypothetical protein
MDEYDEINLGVVSTEYERERQKLNEPAAPNFAGRPTKKLGCLSVFLWLIIGLIAFRLVGEILNLFFKS